ncbi:HER089Wp [Eremothecium sinecaudum]|uniref:HER089Wp n=1 Tax=Eremothecium sinecaudum TaxID=45286 RepID=A0A0X8HTX9_9SACH|nr:HER089Wp [Eremothecium sinecaudum]AMD21368.1 HER089Wp [Eremothecium sinecaudum]
MIDIHTNIKRLKSHIQLADLDSTTNNGWKELIPIVKNNSIEVSITDDNSGHKSHNPNKRLVRDLKSQYLSNNIQISSSPIEYRTCNDCGRPISYAALIDHLHNYCVGKEKGAGKGTTNSKSTSREMSPVKVKKMKRSNSIDLELSPSKKQRKSAIAGVKKQRKVKQRNPTEPHLVDLDKQCGVELPDRGVCGRSLTCKSHSMGSKRAVQGRTKPFDVLLAEYQKKNHIKNPGKGTRTKVQNSNPQQQHIQKQKQQEKEVEQNTPIISPEEETTQVLNGVSRSFPLPLESNVLTSAQTRTKYFRMREMLASSFSVRPGYSTPGYGAIHSRVGCIDIDRTTDYTFRIRVPQLINQTSMQNSSQQFQAMQQSRLKQHQPQQVTPGQQVPSQMIQNSQISQASIQQPSKVQPHSRSQQEQAFSSQQQRLLGQKSPTMGSLTDHSSVPPHMRFDLSSGSQNQHEKTMTPKDIQGQQFLMQQQQRLQQRKKLEDASVQLDNASRLMQGSPINGTTGNIDSGSIGSSVNVNGQGRVNIGLINGLEGGIS